MDHESIISHSELIFQLVLAVILGGLIGLERERKSWFAGLRTHMLVCVGATLIMIVSQYGFTKNLNEGLIVLDPSRVAAQVVSGIGFLGAGTILVWKNMIKGLTTAASLWAVAAVGLAIGGSLYLAAVVTTVLILIVLAVIKPLESLFFKRQNKVEIRLLMKSHSSLKTLEEILTALNMKEDLINLKIEAHENQETIHLLIEDKEDNCLKLIGEFKKIEGIQEVELLPG